MWTEQRPDGRDEEIEEGRHFESLPIKPRTRVDLNVE
jgi:hypothetical protein